MLTIENMHFSYREKPLLEGVNLRVEKETFTAVIGPNGSGKSTLLRLMVGELQQSDGNIILKSNKIHTYTPRERARIQAMIFQGSAIRFPYTCLEVVLMGLHARREMGSGYGRMDMEKALDVMKQTDCDQFAQRSITELSGGETQRVLLARALMQQPELLYLDEAFSAMDVAQRASGLALIRRRVKQNGLTAVAVMHDLNMAYTFADKILLMDKGAIVGFGSPNNVMTEKNLERVFGLPIKRIDGLGFLPTGLGAKQE